MNRPHGMLTLCVVLAAASGGALAEDLSTALSAQETQAVSVAVDRGLQWLSARQNANGAFDGVLRTGVTGPATHPTCFAVLAFLSRGHQPGKGRLGRQIDLSLDFLLSVQRADGSLSTLPPEEPPLTYAHALGGLTLSEAYSSTDGVRAQRIRVAIERALAFSRRMQLKPKLHSAMKGGWQFGYDGDGRSRSADARMSCGPTTFWELKFMRSAHRAGFAVPQDWIDEGLEFITRCYAAGPNVPNMRGLPVGPNQGVFRYSPEQAAHLNWDGVNFNTTAAGMLAFQLHGRRRDPMVLAAADWLLSHPIPQQHENPRFFYGCYILSHAMSQLGGEHWEAFYPKAVRRVLPHQQQDGSWLLRSSHYRPGMGEEKLGPAYNTALAVLCLTLPDQLLPIHQR